MEKELLAIKTEEQLTFVEARRRINELFPNMKTTYATAVRIPPVPCPQPPTLHTSQPATLQTSNSATMQNSKPVTLQTSQSATLLNSEQDISRNSQLEACQHSQPTTSQISPPEDPMKSHQTAIPDDNSDSPLCGPSLPPLVPNYASPTSGEAYRDRRLTTNFEL